MNLDFMPSRQLALYAARLFLTRSLAVLVLLVLVLMALDLLGESGKILGVPGNGQAELWHYVSLRVPILISRFLPFSVLLGALIAFAGLNQHSEVVSMKAAGLSAHQILAPMIVASLAVAAILFVFNETVVVRSQRMINAWDSADYRPIPPESGILSNVWIRDGDDLIRARHIGGRGANTHLENVTIYQRTNGALQRVMDVKRADQVPGGWELKDVATYDANMNLITRQPRQIGMRGVEPTRFTLAKVVPGERDFLSLRQSIDELEAAGRPSEEARTGWWHKLSGPLSTLLMPLLAATAAFGLARSGQVLLRAVVGMALGFTYFVADNFSIALGNIGAYPPFLAAWAPFFLFLLIGELVLIRQEE
ncbi:LPS export ABC transporter permease LptG [Sphingomonas sp. LY29]|uniref:LPS export ABC transporter permease LptG n=1 Tax=Sphingomonas sp. LY29 TaxID=3095341 RepID=UPI002D778847|nr:LPS export ABC transporter permease LptG [Sphingomonas sp. LY29]WRP27059.1 LPS export ABC transporter permease LptG [Sphingomonas sp. LY29]